MQSNESRSRKLQKIALKLITCSLCFVVCSAFSSNQDTIQDSMERQAVINNLKIDSVDAIRHKQVIQAANKISNYVDGFEIYGTYSSWANQVLDKTKSGGKSPLFPSSQNELFSRIREQIEELNKDLKYTEDNFKHYRKFDYLSSQNSLDISDFLDYCKTNETIKVFEGDIVELNELESHVHDVKLELERHQRVAVSQIRITSAGFNMFSELAPFAAVLGEHNNFYGIALNLDKIKTEIPISKIRRLINDAEDVLEKVAQKKGELQNSVLAGRERISGLPLDERWKKAKECGWVIEDADVELGDEELLDLENELDSIVNEEADKFSREFAVKMSAIDSKYSNRISSAISALESLEVTTDGSNNFFTAYLKMMQSNLRLKYQNSMNYPVPSTVRTDCNSLLNTGFSNGTYNASMIPDKSAWLQRCNQLQPGAQRMMKKIKSGFDLSSCIKNSSDPMHCVN
ncbi:hypothetical protein ACD631_16205 [Alteromonas macleodii]|uniref:hypothetical protein n=1 Tax=Alteromonas macleodii TaxID=28108 RepID=UPI0036F47540